MWVSAQRARASCSGAARVALAMSVGPVPGGRAAGARQRLRRRRLRHAYRGRRARPHLGPPSRPAAPGRGRRAGLAGPLPGPRNRMHGHRHRRAVRQAQRRVTPGGPGRHREAGVGHCRRRRPAPLTSSQRRCRHLHRRPLLPPAQARHTAGNPCRAPPRRAHGLQRHLPTPGLPDAEARRAIEAGPPECALHTTYPNLSRSAGFVDVDEHDLTPDYLATARRKLEESERFAAGMAGRSAARSSRTPRQSADSPSAPSRPGCSGARCSSPAVLPRRPPAGVGPQLCSVAGTTAVGVLGGHRGGMPPSARLNSVCSYWRAPPLGAGGVPGRRHTPRREKSTRFAADAVRFAERALVT